MVSGVSSPGSIALQYAACERLVKILAGQSPSTYCHYVVLRLVSGLNAPAYISIFLSIAYLQYKDQLC